jgi:hypothetical protein
MQAGGPVLHGLVVREELEGPVKRPGWNSCDQPVRIPRRACSLGEPVVLLKESVCDSLSTTVELWCNNLSATSGELPGKVAENSVARLLNTL